MAINEEMFYKSRAIAHMLVKQKLQVGDVAIDATMGNGHDTLFLAQCVGSQGQVFAFDIQEQALEKTQTLLKAHNCEARVSLILDGHQDLDQHVNVCVNIVLFNLGFLPGSADKSIVTQVQTTIAAIEKALTILDVGGMIIIVIYPGHEQGADEKQALLKFGSQLSQAQYNVFYIDLINQINNPPVLIGIEKKV